MEVCGLLCDPLKKALHVVTLTEGFDICVHVGQVVVGDMSVDGAVADGMNRNRDGAALALGYNVVKLHAGTEGALTKGAGGWVC